MEEMTRPLGEHSRAGKSMRIAFLHIAPRHDNIQYNLDLLEKQILQAAELKADLVLTPELAVSGYEFYPALGREWIRSEGLSIIEKFCRLALENHITLVLGCPTYDEPSDTYHNSAIVINDTGQVIGSHHKILVLPGSIEGWSASGQVVLPVEWYSQKLGLLICADAYKVSIAEELAKQGASVLISLAAWAAGEHAPNGEWEKCTQNTGLCFYVCNRTGQSTTLNFEGSSSVVVAGGRRVAEYAGIPSAILTMDFDESWQPLNPHFSTYPIESEA